MGIKQLVISCFKSIDTLELTELPNYCVIAGANGAGKSNFCDALKFASTVIDEDAGKAIRRFGGYELLHCVKRFKEKARTFQFHCIQGSSKTMVDYRLEVHCMDKEPVLCEKMEFDGNSFVRGKDGKIVANTTRRFPFFPEEISPQISFLRYRYSPHRSLNWLRDIEIFRFDPFRAKEPDDVGADPNYLDPFGRNLSTVLEKMQGDKEQFETIMDWMRMIVPGLEKIKTHRNPLDGRASMIFQEKGTKYHFSPGLISDGTIYVLCLLAAVLSRKKSPGLTIIEEPERGIHPKAIEQISTFFRDHATNEHPIFITTHNESFVRSAKPDELLFAYKKEGATQFRMGRDSAKSVKGMPLDKAWLQNMFDGGLPW